MRYFAMDIGNDMWGGSQQPLVISEPELVAALEHLRALPQSVTAEMPHDWGRKRLLDTITELVGEKYQVDDCIPVAPGLWVLIKPFGIDLMMKGKVRTESRLQAWLLIRPVGTDPNMVTEIHGK